ncbi:hypothetical protein NQ317_016161 [Molorchus minor]|uniref:Uncharacterized protein n=1 Tax=Molorchus minor TaxID=1323400 RepID=A0ABQ9IXP3_9CUCU|nr:hypothetical protein NQ317_016161 [Molorchus minor]
MGNLIAYSRIWVTFLFGYRTGIITRDQLSSFSSVLGLDTVKNGDYPCIIIHTGYVFSTIYLEDFLMD